MPVPICLTFDNMGLAADVGRGIATVPDPHEPGLMRGYPAILDLLQRHGVTATFFVEGWNGVHHPDRVAGLIDAGHEVAAHGWVHEAWRTLDEETERELLKRTVESLQRCGADVHGFRAPGGERSAVTLQLLAEAGFRYDASLDASGVHMHETGVVVLPFVWEHVDWHWFGAQDPPAAPAAFENALRTGLTRSAASSEPLVVIIHARTSALDDARFAVLERFLSEVVSDPRFETLRMQDMAHRIADGDT